MTRLDDETKAFFKRPRSKWSYKKVFQEGYKAGFEAGRDERDFRRFVFIFVLLVIIALIMYWTK